SIVLSIVAGDLLPRSAVVFLVFNARSRRWMVIPTSYLVSLLKDLFLPEEQRPVSFATDEVRDGILPGATDFNGTGLLDDGNPSVLCLLGAACAARLLSSHSRIEAAVRHQIRDGGARSDPDLCARDLRSGYG